MDLDLLGGYIATIVVSLIVGYLSRFLEPRSKLLGWSPHNFVFHLREENVTLQTNSLTLQNVGRRPAERLEIIHAARPDFFQFWPSVSYTEDTTTNGEHVIRIDMLGPKEVLFLQLFSYRTGPELRNIRWSDGQVRWVQVAPQRVWPRWVLIAIRVLLIVGAGTVAYWLIRAGVYIFAQVLG